MFDKDAVTRRIRSLCTDKGVTYKQMAADLDVPEGTMKSWVYGERKLSLENALMFADYFGVSLDVIAARTPPVAVA